MTCNISGNNAETLVTNTVSGNILGTATAGNGERRGIGIIAEPTGNNVGPQSSIAVAGNAVFNFNGNDIQGSRSHAVNFFADANSPLHQDAYW